MFVDSFDLEERCAIYFNARELPLSVTEEPPAGLFFVRVVVVESEVRSFDPFEDLLLKDGHP